ncbi:MAG TPA: hypothetical protein VGX94_12300 [Terriglobia bacterium]|nr:hypothetical protein [Terriglobia bacterium]
MSGTSTDFVMLSPSLVILSGAKDPGIWLRVNSTKHPGIFVFNRLRRFLVAFGSSE